MVSIVQRQQTFTPFSETLSPLLQRIYSARGVQSEDELLYQLNNLQRPAQLKGLDDAVTALVTAVTQQQKILIVGDFDADGATATSVALLALSAMGLKHVDFLVPNRFEYGYGLTPEIVAVAAERSPDLIITVDNGIASIEGVKVAKEMGIDVVITDHHLPGTEVPDALAIVNPNQQGCPFPSKNLAGVGVIFYVMSALRTALRKINWFVEQVITEPNMAEFLDLVALGTVADVVPLDTNNRILVQQGLLRIRAGQSRPGIRALLQVAGRNHQQIYSQDLGFTLGPRLNAAGRLDDMTIGIRCLITEDADEAQELASMLDGFNRDRRAIEGVMQKEALSLLDELSVETELPWGLALFHEQWHQGVVGILASRIKEKYHRPVIAFAPAEEEGWIKGSARSIEGLHIRDALDRIATKRPDVLQKFGGHAMAAGLTLKTDHFSVFQEEFDQVVREQLDEASLEETLTTDGELTTELLNLQTAYDLQAAGPWGQHFPEPLFDGEFLLINQRIVGEKHLKLTLANPEAPQVLMDAIAFNIDVEQWPDSSVKKIKVVYQLTVNHFRGIDSPQLRITYLEKTV